MPHHQQYPYRMIEVLYGFESTNDRGYSVIVHPGEKYVLLCDRDPEWWYVARDSDNADGGFYIPRTYVTIISTQVSSHHNNKKLVTFRRQAAGRTSNVEIVAGSAIVGDRHLSQSSPPDNDENGVYGTAPLGGGVNSTSLTRRGERRGSFKLADPSRISRSIPYDLNFVHHIPYSTDDENNGENEFGPADIDFYGAHVYAGQSQESRIEFSQKRAINKNSTTNGAAAEKSLSTIADGPIYANLPLFTNMASAPPAAPADETKSLRILQDGWRVYDDQYGRPYFFNIMTRLSTWKPPRIVSLFSYKNDGSTAIMSSGDELDSSLSADDLEKSQYELASVSSLAVKIAPAQRNSYFGGVETVLPGTAGGLDGSNYSKTSELTSSLESSYHERELFDSCELGSCTFTDSTDATISVAAELQQNPEEKILSCVSKSCGVPPPLPVKDTTRRSAEFSGQESTNLSLSPKDGHETTKISAVNNELHKTGSFRASQSVLKRGLISKCKYTEAGKRVKKQWLSCFAYLTSAHLIFYKDEKSAEKKGNQYEAPMGVCDLRGATLKWLESDKSRRRRVFQLELINGTSYLFHSEDNQDIMGWYQAISKAINLLPKPDPSLLQLIEHSPNRSHARKLSNVSSVFTSSKELQRENTEQQKNAVQSKDSKKASSMSNSLTGSTYDSSSNEHQQQQQQIRETILEKLRRFFFSRPSIEVLKEKGIYKPEPVFGSSLIDICAREKSIVPKFLLVCTALIEDKGLDNDGLYRMSGNLSQVQKIRCQVDQDKYTLLQNETDVHVLTGALKLFFRELPNSLFPVDMTKDFLNAIKIQEPKSRMKRFRELLPKMPLPHRDCLDLLLRHLLKVADHAHKNRMQIHNLAIVFGPTLFSTESNRTTAEAGRKKKLSGKSSTGGGAAGCGPPPPAELIQSNSHLAFTMIMQGQIVEYMLKEYNRLLKCDNNK